MYLNDFYTREKNNLDSSVRCWREDPSGLLVWISIQTIWPLLQADVDLVSRVRNEIQNDTEDSLFDSLIGSINQSFYVSTSVTFQRILTPFDTI